MSRGFACIGLHRPKDAANIGGAMRAAACYRADLIVIDGGRYRRSRTDTPLAHRHIPTLVLPDDQILNALPVDCEPVAVDLIEGATPLPRFRHPERAFYIFGPEDGTLGPDVVGRCRHRVMVPTAICMNLAATVNVVLYDRLAKHGPCSGEPA